VIVHPQYVIVHPQYVIVHPQYVIVHPQYVIVHPVFVIVNFWNAELMGPAESLKVLKVLKDTKHTN